MGSTGGGGALIGERHGRRPERGMAIIVSIAGVLALIASVQAWNSGHCWRLSAASDKRAKAD